jgi:hypothetical protein
LVNFSQGVFILGHALSFKQVVPRICSRCCYFVELIRVYQNSCLGENVQANFFGHRFRLSMDDVEKQEQRGGFIAGEANFGRKSCVQNSALCIATLQECFDDTLNPISCKSLREASEENLLETACRLSFGLAFFIWSSREPLSRDPFCARERLMNFPRCLTRTLSVSPLSRRINVRSPSRSISSDSGNLMF